MLDKTSIISYSQANFPQSFDSLPDLKVYDFGFCYEKYVVKVGTISTNQSAQGVYAFTGSGDYATFHEGLNPHGRLIDQIQEIRFNYPSSSIFGVLARPFPKTLKEPKMPRFSPTKLKARLGLPMGTLPRKSNRPPKILI